MKCDVTDCDGEAIAAWRYEPDDTIWNACEKCGDHFHGASGWNYVSQV